MSYSGSGEPDRGDTEGVTGRTVSPNRRSSEGPDVHLDVPQLKVDEITLEVENLRAHVSLSAEVLDLLRLNVGADVVLGKVDLEIKGVEAQALLDVRLDNVAVIVDRVLTTLDRNPEILQHVGRGVEAAARDLGAGTGTAVGEVGRGARGAVEDVGRGAGGAVQDVGRGAGGAVEDVGRGAGGAVQDVGRGAGGAVEDVGAGAGGAVRDAGAKAGDAVEDIGSDTPEAARDLGVKDAAGDVKDADAAPASEKTEPDSGTAEKDREGEPEASPADQQDASALQDALHETEESVRDLGRALLRMLRSSGGGGRHEPR